MCYSSIRVEIKFTTTTTTTASNTGAPKTIETLRSRFGHFTGNDKLRFAVNGFTLLVCPYLGLRIRGWQLAAAIFVIIYSLTYI